MRGRGRGRRKVRHAGLGIAVLAASLLGYAGASLLDRAFPPDMTRFDAVSREVVDGEGGPLAWTLIEDGRLRLPVDATDVDPGFVTALIAFEDGRFRSHPGVDPLALLRAAGQAVLHGRVVSGASTLTMQLARLLEPRPRTLGAKAIEMARALQLERRFTKDEILSLYLTLAPYGGNLEGIRAATRSYWGKEPGRLSDAEIALLVALPQSPERLRPDRQPAAARAARVKVASQLAVEGHWPIGRARQAVVAPLPVDRRPLPAGAPHLTSRLLAERPASTRIETRIDPELQAAASDVVRHHVHRLGPDRNGAALILALDDAGNGPARVAATRVYVGSTGIFERAREGGNDLVRALRSPGSTLKPLIYGMAFEDGSLAPGSLLVDRETAYGGWRPSNLDGLQQGDVTAADALQRSLNNPAIAALERVGPRRFLQRMEEAGEPMVGPSLAADPGLAVGLGGGGIDLEGLARLYAALAGDGRMAEAAEADDANGAEPARLLSEEAAGQVRRILLGAPRPPGRADRRSRGIAFKTGTSFGHRDAWAIGFDAGHVVAVWIGRPDGRPVPNATGLETAAPLLFRLFDLLPSAPIRDAAIDGQRIAQDERPLARSTESRLDFEFPQNDTTIHLPAGRRAALPIRIRDGAAPFRLLVDDRPEGPANRRRTLSWQPPGPGFYRLAVIDATGAARSVRVEIRR